MIAFVRIHCYSGFPKETPELKFRLRFLFIYFFFFSFSHILVPRGRAPYGQHQESRPLAWSNTGSPRFTDFPSLCACSESSLTNLIGSGLNLLCFQSHSKTEFGQGQRSRFLVLTKRSAASGDENGSATVCNSVINTHARRFY